MKCSHLAAFKAQLKESPLPAYLMVNSEREEQREWLNLAIQALGKPQKIFDAETISRENFFQTVDTIPFLVKKSVVVLQEIDHFDKVILKDIETYLANPSTFIILLMTATELAATSALFKKVVEKGVVMQIPQEKPWEKQKRLVSWLCEEAAEHGVELPFQVATEMVKEIEAPFLKSELEKLLTFIGERKEITQIDFSVISIGGKPETLWQFGDALLQKIKGKAIAIGHQLLDEGISLFVILAHLRSQIQTAIRMLNIYHQEGKTGVQTQFPYLKGNLLDTKMRTSEQFGLEALKRAQVQLFECELKARNSSITPPLLLELLISEIAN